MASYFPKSTKYLELEVAAGDKGKRIGDLKEPRGIAINNDSYEDHIYIADKLNNRVQVFDSNMEYSFHFGSSPGEGKMMKPIGICLSTEYDRVYVTQFSFNAVYAYLLDGSFVRRAGTTGVENDIKVKSIDLFVLDESSKYVKVFTIDGYFLVQMVSAGPYGRIIEPYAFDIDKKGRIYISDCRSSCIQVFEMNGKYKYDIGEEGEGLGEFRYPTGLALIGNGRQLITACERKENQIQVFDL